VANPCPEGFVPVPAGQFNMGAPETEPGYWWGCDDETVHQVTLSRPFCLKRTEVTQAEWKAVMGNNPSDFATCGDDCPVEMLNWFDALAWCNARSEAEGLAPCYTLTGCTGKAGSGSGWDTATAFQCTSVAFAGPGCTGYRLPTEAEWEYAARAGTTAGTYRWPLAPGRLECEHPNVLDAIAWYAGTSCAQSSDGSCRTTDCGTRPVATK
jgi:formylglycine-generating enzyme required for sulfatase activity